LPFIENNDIINHKRCIRQLFKEYKATKRGDNFMNEIVKYHKDFEKKLVLKNFTASELNFLMAICTKVRDKKEDEKIAIFKDSLDFLNIMGSYAEAQYYIDEYIDRKFPIFRKKYIR